MRRFSSETIYQNPDFGCRGRGPRRLFDGGGGGSSSSSSAQTTQSYSSVSDYDQTLNQLRDSRNAIGEGGLGVSGDGNAVDVRSSTESTTQTLYQIVDGGAISENGRSSRAAFDLAGYLGGDSFKTSAMLADHTQSIARDLAEVMADNAESSMVRAYQFADGAIGRVANAFESAGQASGQASARANALAAEVVSNYQPDSAGSQQLMMALVIGAVVVAVFMVAK